MKHEKTSTAGAPLLDARRLRFSYPERHVLNGWSRSFPGGVTWLRGGNGSGKSTLLKLLAGALVPAAGDTAVRGVSQQAQPLAYRREVFWCSPGPLPFDHLSPDAYFAFMRSLYGRMDQAAIEAHVRGFALEPHLSVPLRTLSTGTQRKVWLAAALAAGTTVTLLDEPFNALDAASTAWLSGSLVSCAADRNRCWVIASHERLDTRLKPAVVLDLDSPMD